MSSIIVHVKHGLKSSLVNIVKMPYKNASIQQALIKELLYLPDTLQGSGDEAVNRTKSLP